MWPLPAIRRVRVLRRKAALSAARHDRAPESANASLEAIAREAFQLADADGFRLPVRQRPPAPLHRLRRRKAEAARRVLRHARLRGPHRHFPRRRQETSPNKAGSSWPDHTLAFDRSVLLSWTGTMFEYLMPSLWMRSYPDTLVARTLAAAVEIQRDFAANTAFPGASPSQAAPRKDDAGHYHYQAYGIPAMALSGTPRPAPSSRPIPLSWRSVRMRLEASDNLRRMAKAGWVGAYGFYESADFSQTRGGDTCARVDGPPPGHVAAGHHEFASRQHRSDLVPRQPADSGDGTTTP